MKKFIRAVRFLVVFIAMLEILDSLYVLFDDGFIPATAGMLAFWYFALAVTIYFHCKERGMLVGKRGLFNPVVLGIVMIGVVLYGLVTVAYNVNPPGSNRPITSSSDTSTYTREALWAEANEYRDISLPLDSVLNDTAQAKCEAIVANGKFEHGDISQMAEILGVSVFGENLAEGYVSAKELLEAWAASPDHNANLKDTDWTRVGYGICYSDVLGMITVQHFSN